MTPLGFAVILGIATDLGEIMGNVLFDGQAPYAMPVTQHTKAFAVGDMVEAHIHVLVDTRQIESVIVTLTQPQAVLLAQHLNLAAGEALGNKHRT
jgi:hypothetical protein